MNKINQTEYKRQVIKVLKENVPMWLSDLHKKHGLPYATIHGSKNNPASKAFKKALVQKTIDF